MPVQSSNLSYQALILTIGLYWTYNYWITLIPTLVYLFWIGQNLLHSPKVKGLNDFDLTDCLIVDFLAFEFFYDFQVLKIGMLL